jgi:ribonuclease HII
MNSALLVAGVDEVGRGPLAGPVVAAAVVLDPDRPIAGLKDSKCLSPRRRRLLARHIRRQARAWSIALVDHSEVDRINVLRASLLAMRLAVERLDLIPEQVLVDGSQVPEFGALFAATWVEAIVRGDQTVPSISAASILAKVFRDRLMCRWARKYPGYGFAEHKGYPTRSHLANLERLGPCLIHRQSFAPVRRVLSLK